MDILSFCHAYPTAVRPHPTNCAQYYDCSTAAFGGSQNRECPYPQLFDAVTLTCKPFTDVQCGVRYEPKAPCKYFVYQGRQSFVILFDQAEVNCLSVLGVNFGLSLTMIYYAILVRILAITDFLWLISIWFCSYTISWGLRFILTWFYLGEYQANQCSPGQQSCEPCTSRKPSCVGLDDGNQPFPGRLWQQQFIVCNKNRTTSVSRCPRTSVFNPNTKQCVEIQNITKCE